MNLSDLIAQAEEAGADFKKVLIPNSTYLCEVTHLNYNESKAGNPGFGVRTVVKEGPYAGKGFWSNFYLTPQKKNGELNSAGIAIFFRQMEALGFSSDEFKAGLTVEDAVKSQRSVGTLVLVETEENEYPKGSGEKSTRAKNIKKAAAAAGTAPQQPQLPLTPAAIPGTAPGRPF